MSTLNMFSWRNKKTLSFPPGGGWVGQTCRVSYLTRASSWCWLAVGQGLLSLQQVRVERKCFYFFWFFTFIHIPLSPLSFSFISSTISSLCLLPFSGRWHKMTHKGWCVVKPQHNQTWKHNVKLIIGTCESTSNEFPQHMFLWRNKIPWPAELGYTLPLQTL